MRLWLIRSADKEALPVGHYGNQKGLKMHRITSQKLVMRQLIVIVIGTPQLIGYFCVLLLLLLLGREYWVTQ